MRRTNAGLRVKPARLFAEDELSALVYYLGRLAGAMPPLARQAYSVKPGAIGRRAPVKLRKARRFGS
jgi:hypothetical protein